MRQLYLGVGHEGVKSDEHSPDKGIGDEADEKFQNRGQYHEVLQFLDVGAHENGQTAGNHKQYGKQQNQRRIVGNLPEQTAWLLYLPDGIKATFDVVNQQQDGTQQHDEAHTDENSALCMFQIGINPADDKFSLCTCYPAAEL